MSVQDRIEALKEKHASLERALDEEVHRPLPNQDTVHDLKRQKLRIKDEIFQLERQYAPGSSRAPKKPERPRLPGFFVARVRPAGGRGDRPAPAR
jgi:hypothetical protein